MASIRIINRHGGAEVLGGLVGGPLLVVAAAWVWLGDDPSPLLRGARWYIFAAGSAALPFFVVYWFYRAVFVCTLWIEISDQIVVRHLFRERSYGKLEVGAICFDSEPMRLAGPDYYLPGIAVGHERFLVVRCPNGRVLGKMRINRKDRISLICHLQKHGPRELLSLD